MLASLWEPLLKPSWAPLGHSFGPQAMRNQSPWCPWASQEPIPTLCFWPWRPPRAVQERPVRPWKHPLGRPSLFNGSKRPPRDLQETSRGHLAAIFAQMLINFEVISMRCCRHVGHVSSLKASSPRALDPMPQARRNARSDWINYVYMLNYTLNVGFTLSSFSIFCAISRTPTTSSLLMCLFSVYCFDLRP